MNNEIGRKITSLTLMTIMIAGGLTFAVPGAMPAAHAANANLFVSAENSQFDNYMSGPQVIEVVVIDSDINDTDEAKGEPDVTVNGKIMRMVQAVDGNWYGYFADRTMAQKADDTTTTGGEGLDFGIVCTTPADVTAAEGFTNVDFGDADGVAFGATSCAGAGVDSDLLNVLREAKGINTNAPTGDGQINATASSWPFVQLYNLNPTGNVVIQYNKGGGVQTTTLTFDTVDQFVEVELDRSSYTRGSEVHATISDIWLNIDPTDEDSWTFGTTGTNDDAAATTHYQVFDENGQSVGDSADNTDDDLTGALGDLMCEDNCRLITDADVQGKGAVITLDDNDDSAITPTFGGADEQNPLDWETEGTNLSGNVPVTITEQGPNSGIFGTYDESDDSNIVITETAARGTSASITYNEDGYTILVGFAFGSIDIQPIDEEWSSGEEIPVVLVDGDANENSRADEDLDLFNPDVALIPSLRTGDPFSIGEVGTESSTVADIGFVANFTVSEGSVDTADTAVTTETLVQRFSQRAIIETDAPANVTHNALFIDFETDVADFTDTFLNPADDFNGFNLLNLDIRSLNATGPVDVYLIVDPGNLLADDGTVVSADVADAILIADGVAKQSLTVIDAEAVYGSGILDTDTDNVGLAIEFATDSDGANDLDAIVADFFSFGFTDDGVEADERISNQIIRLELEETGDNTSTFEGSLEYIMVNQLNILDEDLYAGLSPIADDPTFIVIEDLTDEDSPRVNYFDLGADGVSTQVADQEEAPSHSGIVSFDNDSYKTADTVIITVEDLDLNVDSDLVDIYTIVGLSDEVIANGGEQDAGAGDILDEAYNTVGEEGLPVFGSFGALGRLLDVTFDDIRWMTPVPIAEGGVPDEDSDDCLVELQAGGVDTGLDATGFTLIETSRDSGVFEGDFQVPAFWCRAVDSELGDDDLFQWEEESESVTGLDMEVNYVDFRDASGEIIEVGDSAGIRANTGSVSLDRTVYPVPFGVPSDFEGVEENENNPQGRSVFPIHQTGLDDDAGLQTGEFLANGDLQVHIRVNDPDFDVSASGEDEIAQNVAGEARGPVKISIIRGANSVVLGHAGGPQAIEGVIDVNDNGFTDGDEYLVDGDEGEVPVRQFGPIEEIAPDAGIFELDLTVRYTDGPANAQCPPTSDYTPINGDPDVNENDVLDRFSIEGANGNEYCILQGDIIQVEYTDPADASGDENTVTDSATFDLRNGVLQSDKSVYIIGSDMILTLIEPDFDLDNDAAETFDLDIIEWDSDAATVSMGNAGGEAAAFDPEPSNFRETGDSTGIFQIVIEIPEELDNDKLERGEEIILEYTDWGPSGSDFVGDEDEDVNLTLYTSNFGATVELDQKVYSWTDKVYITIVAPDHNFDSDLVDEIGNTDLDPIKVSTRGNDLDNYKLVETGTDTGIFTGEVILTGFPHNADGDTTTGDDTGSDTNPRTIGNGPTDGFLEADDDDGITVSFEFSEDETVVGSALIRWNIGEVQWLEASYPASGTGVVRVIDPDMNLDPEAVDNFDVDVWSDSDAGGIDLTVTETNEATGIFEGTVFFTVTDESSGHRLRVAEGDTVTAEYEDNTLPDPYTTADELDITATSLIGTVVPPLERAPAANLRTVDAFGNSLDTVNVDQQVQITADLANGQDREQPFAYLVQIQDANGVTVSLAWITGSLAPGQSFSPALSWIPTAAGTYTATAFVWESVDNPTALSPPVSTTVTVI